MIVGLFVLKMKLLANGGMKMKVANESWGAHIMERDKSLAVDGANNIKIDIDSKCGDGERVACEAMPKLMINARTSRESGKQSGGAGHILKNVSDTRSGGGERGGGRGACGGRW